MKQYVTRTLAALLALLLVSLCLIACSPVEEEVPENMQVATLPGSHYRLYLPVGWNLLQTVGLSGGYASLQNMVLIYMSDFDNPDNLTPEAYWDTIYQAKLAAAFENDSFCMDGSEEPQSASDTQDFINPAVTKLGGQDALLFSYTGTRELVSYHCKELLCAKGGRMYVLSFCARYDLYEEYETAFAEVVTAFIFSDTPYEADEPIHTVDKDADAPNGMQLASNDDVAYRFYVPATWVLDTTLPTSSAYVSTSDRSNVNVTSYMPSESMSAETYWQQHLRELRTYMQIDDSSITVSKTELDGRPANIYEFTATVGTKQYRYAQAIAAYSGVVYVVTYTALPENYDTHRAAYDDILAAFDFRGNKTTPEQSIE